MRLGTETGSLMNHLMANVVAEEIKIGVGATVLGWTDRSPATVIGVERKGKSIYVTVQYDNYKRTDSNGMSESQEYEYTPDPEGATRTFRSTNGGGWVTVVFNSVTNRWSKSMSGCGLVIGQRERYNDFSF